MPLANFSMGELLIILLVLLLVFGAKRLPEMGSSLGRGIREFKKGINEAADALREDSPRKQAPPSQSALPPAGRSDGEPKRLSD